MEPERRPTINSAFVLMPHHPLLLLLPLRLRLLLLRRMAPRESMTRPIGRIRSLGEGPWQLVGD